MTSQRRRLGGFSAQLALLVLLGLALRLGWAARQSNDAAAIGKTLPDQREYLDAGRNLLAGRGLCFLDPRFGQTVYAYRTPGYPVLIAICDGSIVATRIVQTVLDASTILAVALIAVNLGLSRGVALVAGLIVALDPFLIYFSALLLSETLYLAVLIWAMALLTLGARRQKIWLFWLADVVMALSLLVRPSALLFPVIARGAAALLARQSAKQTIIGLASSAACCVIALGLWGYRNERVIGEWVFTTTNSGITLYDGFNPAATGASDQRFVLAMPELQSMNEGQRSRYLSRLAMQYIEANPRQCAGLTLVKIARTWSPLPLSDTYQTRTYTLAGLLFSLPLDVLVILGLMRRKNNVASMSWPAKLFLLAPAAYFTVVHGLSVGSLRYRLPAEPSMAVIAAFALSPLLGNLCFAWMGRHSDNRCAQPTAES